MRTHLAERLTWRYTDAHAHQDEWSDTVQGYFQILSVSQPVYPPNANRDTWCKYLRVKAPAHLTRNEVVRVLSSNFRHGCTLDADNSHTWLAMGVDGKPCSAGPTPLVAAMRCYVASKLGDVVDVPKELVLTIQAKEALNAEYGPLGEPQR